MGDGQNILGIIIAILFINTSVAGLVDLAIKDGEGNRIKAFERKLKVVKISAVFRLFRQRKDNNKKDVDVFLVFSCLTVCVSYVIALTP